MIKEWWQCWNKLPGGARYFPGVGMIDKYKSGNPVSKKVAEHWLADKCRSGKDGWIEPVVESDMFKNRKRKTR